LSQSSECHKALHAARQMDNNIVMNHDFNVQAPPHHLILAQSNQHHNTITVNDNNIDTMNCHPAANDEDAASMVATNSVDSPNTATPPSLCFTVEQHSIVNLMKILSDIDAPDRAFGSIMKWAKAAHDKQFHFDPKTGHSVNNQYRWMRQLVANSARLLPSVIPVSLGDQKTV